MRKLLCALGLGLALIATTAQAKVGVVNIADIFQKMPEREKISRQLENEFKGRLDELQKMEKELQDSMQKFQKDAAKMKPADRTAMEKTINEKRSVFATKAETFEKDNRRRQGEERNKLLAKIQKAVQDVAKKENYTVIVDVSAIAYADGSVDVTEAVRKQVK